MTGIEAKQLSELWYKVLLLICNVLFSFSAVYDSLAVLLSLSGGKSSHKPTFKCKGVLYTNKKF